MPLRNLSLTWIRVVLVSAALAIPTVSLFAEPSTNQLGRISNLYAGYKQLSKEDRRDAVKEMGEALETAYRAKDHKNLASTLFNTIPEALTEANENLTKAGFAKKIASPALFRQKEADFYDSIIDALVELGNQQSQEWREESLRDQARRSAELKEQEAAKKAALKRQQKAEQKWLQEKRHMSWYDRLDSNQKAYLARCEALSKISSQKDRNVYDLLRDRDASIMMLDHYVASAQITEEEYEAERALINQATQKRVNEEEGVADEEIARLGHEADQPTEALVEIYGPYIGSYKQRLYAAEATIENLRTLQSSAVNKPMSRLQVATRLFDALPTALTKSFPSLQEELTKYLSVKKAWVFQHPSDDGLLDDLIEILRSVLADLKT